MWYFEPFTSRGGPSFVISFPLLPSGFFNWQARTSVLADPLRRGNRTFVCVCVNSHLESEDCLLGIWNAHVKPPERFSGNGPGSVPGGAKITLPSLGFRLDSGGFLRPLTLYIPRFETHVKLQVPSGLWPFIRRAVPILTRPSSEIRARARLLNAKRKSEW